MPGFPYIFVGIQEFQLGGGAFPIDVSLAAMAVQNNDIFVADVWIEGPYSGPGWSWYGTLGPGPSLTNSLSTFPVSSGADLEWWDTVAGTQQTWIHYAGA
jgi:hypothetical protein